MLILIKSFIIINILINIIYSQKQNKYKHYNYDQIMSIFQELSISCSHYIKIDTSQTRYNLDSIEGCGTNNNCTNLIVFLTDFDSYTLDRPAYYISGVLHGDEVLGPSSVTEFAKYFCDSYATKKNSLYHNILKNKLIIITPMTNAYGYYNKKREEKVFIPSKNNYINADPNRDFPYYNSVDNTKTCMQTLSARTINEIFNEFIIGGGITFHGGTTVLGYAWGNYIHVNKKGNYIYSSTEAPDYNAFDTIGRAMVKFSSSKDNTKKNIKDFILGDMTSTIYPLDGALEDWAYGGWENKQYEKMGISLRPIKTCKADSFNPYDMVWNNNNNLNSNDIDYNYKLRCLMYLAELSDKKSPSEEYYGINDFNTDKKGDLFDFYKTTNFFGHIPRIMRLMYSGIDLISASIYLDIENIQIQKKDNIVIIPFLFMGCFSLQKFSIYQIHFNQIMRSNLETEFLISNSNKSTLISEVNENISCYFNNLTYYNLVIQQNDKDKSNLRNLRKLEEQNNKNKDPMNHFKRPGGNYDFLGNNFGVKYVNGSFVKIPEKGSIFFIKGVGPDQNWVHQQNPDPKVVPQSHVVRSKINSNYFVKNGNYSLKSNYHIYSYPVVAYDNGEIQIVDDIDSFFYEDEFNFMEMIINSNNNNYKIIGFLSCVKQKDQKHKNNYEKYLSSEKIFDVNVEIHIFQEKDKNFFINLLKEKKEIKLFSQILLNDENENYHLKLLQCQYSGQSSLIIKCKNLLEKIRGRDIRQKLANSILGFELKIEKETFLNFFGQITIRDYNKGKYYVDFYSDNDYNDNNKMLCTSNFPYYINIFTNYQNSTTYSFDDIYYTLNISKISTTKLKLSIDIKQNEDNQYNYFLLYFPFYDFIEVFDIKNQLLEVVIDLDEKANGKIIGKEVYVVAIEEEDFFEASNYTFQTKDYMSFLVSLNKISKNKNYKLVPCSIMSFNSFINKKSYTELRTMVEKFSEIKPYVNREKNMAEKFIYKHFIISTVVLSLFLILIFFLLYKKFRKRKFYRNFDKVIIAESTHASGTNL